MTEGWMADVVDQRERFSKSGVEAEGCGDGAGDLGYFKGVGEATARVIALRAPPRENLGFAGKAAKGFGVEDAANIAREGRTVGMRGLGITSSGEWIVRIAGNGDGWAKKQTRESKVGVLHERP